MGGEGSMAAANASLKNNRNLLSKRKENKAFSGSYANLEIKKFPKATPQKLNEIREKLIRENKEIRIKQLIWFVCALLGLAVFIFFLLK